MAEVKARLALVNDRDFTDAMLLAHLQWLIDRRGSHDSTGQVMINYEEHGPLIGLWAGEIGWGCPHVASGTTVREALVASLRAVQKAAQHKKRAKVQA